jgi:hypothetical protein
MAQFSASDLQRLRRFSRATAQAILRRTWPAIRIAPIDSKALASHRFWRERAVNWDWRMIVRPPLRDRFDVAVWHAKVLCALAYGPSDGQAVSINYLEGNPDASHPLKGHIVDIAIVCLEVQAVAFDLKETRLIEPFVELIPLYRARGYQPVE